MSVGAITHSLFSAAGVGSGAAATGGTQFASAMSAATGATGAAASTGSNPVGQIGTDLQSFLLQLGGGGSGGAKDASATTASANSTAGLHGHGHHHGAAQEGSGDLVTDFANNAIT